MDNIQQKTGIELLEKKWNQYWIENGTYSFVKNIDSDTLNEKVSDSDIFAIDTPPPTISGFLHMGHIYSYTHTDFIARFNRMNGKYVFYPIGLDDNGLPTEKLVEKIHDIKAHSMDRDEFIKLSQQTIAKSKEEYINLFKAVGLSIDFDHEYHTISEDVQKISQMSFIDLYNKGLILRRQGPTLWDVVDKTALSQAEIIDRLLDSTMNEIIFKTTNDEPIIIATTRPELLGACVAVLYNPNDDRYKHLKGKEAFTPLFLKKVPIIEDEKVDQSKGTGIVMCCTFGDMQDIEWWRKYNFPLINTITLDGKIQNSLFLNGLSIKDAREKILSKLSEENLLVSQKNIKHSVKCGERSNSPIEIVVTSQWYISILQNKERILEKVNQIKWYPEYMKVRIEQWINGLHHDWCISRQRFFGVPFPVWYSKKVGEEGKIILADIEQLPINPINKVPKGYGIDDIIGDMDVMDTWATSSLTPELSLSTFSKNEKSKIPAIPFQLRPQSHEIIRTWAFYTILKSLYHDNTIPWCNIMISGWCLANDKTKMSKSKGNVVTPQGLLNEHGADVIRYWASTGKLGTDTAYSETTFKIAKKLILKLQNACHFLFIHLDKLVEADEIEYKNCTYTAISNEFSNLNSIDKWLLSELNLVIDKATKEFQHFEYYEARYITEKFFWDVLCDNYLEMIKDRIYGNSIQNKRSTVAILVYCIDSILRMFAPFIPYTTEELYYQLMTRFEKSMSNEKDKKIYVSIHSRNMWPTNRTHFEQNVLEKGRSCIEFIEMVRKFKSTNKMSVASNIKKVEIYSQDSFSESDLLDLKCATKSEEIKQIKDQSEIKNMIMLKKENTNDTKNSGTGNSIDFDSVFISNCERKCITIYR